MYRVHGDRAGSPSSSYVGLQDSFGRNVAIAQPGINENRVALGNEDLVVHRIERQPGQPHQLRFRPLDDAKGRHLSVRSAFEGQNGLGKLLRHHEFIVDRVILDSVHRPAYKSFLSINRPPRACSTIRQPGECRNLRMGDSVGHQNLFPFGVIGQGMWISQARRPGIERSAADDAQRRGVA